MVGSVPYSSTPNIRLDQFQFSPQSNYRVFSNINFGVKINKKCCWRNQLSISRRISTECSWTNSDIVYRTPFELYERTLMSQWTLDMLNISRDKFKSKRAKK